MSVWKISNTLVFFLRLTGEYLTIYGQRSRFRLPNNGPLTLLECFSICINSIGNIWNMDLFENYWICLVAVTYTLVKYPEISLNLNKWIKLEDWICGQYTLYKLLFIFLIDFVVIRSFFSMIICYLYLNTALDTLRFKIFCLELVFYRSKVF